MNLLQRNGFAVKAIAITLLAFIVASIGSIAYTYRVTGERATKTLHARMEQLLATVGSTLEVACYVKDAQLAAEVAGGLMSNPEVLGVTIRDENEVRAEAGRHDTGNTGGRGMDQLTRNIASPFAKGQVLGDIRLTANPDVVEQIRDADIQLAVRQLMLQLLFVLAIIIAALMHFFIRPISRLAVELHHKDPTAGEHIGIPAGHAHTEIGGLVREVNQLSDRLVDAMKESEKARALAEAASDAKGAFLANMSHEIRTPMNAVLGLARIGARDTSDAASRDHFQRILASGEHLLGVLNDILDFSRIEAGKLEVELAPLRLRQLLGETADLMQGRCAEKGLTFTIETGADLPEWVDGDALHIRQILVNLLSNAIKFTAQGHVRLAVHARDGEVRFIVSDDGIGMNEEQLSRIFMPFEQASNETTRRFGGTGLGLAISLQLARLMGGEIQAVSQPGQGSQFTLHLPLRAIPAPATAPAPGAAKSAPAGRRLAGVRVLAAEDIELNRFVLEDMLRHEGAGCRFAENGRQAVDIVKQQRDAFDIVLMDIQMPEMDGHRATQLIHAMAPDLPVIGLTAHALKHEQDKCLASGMVAHLAKPVDPEQLVATLRQWLPECVPDQPGPPAQAAATSAPVRSQVLEGTGRAIDWPALAQRYHARPGMIGKLLKAVAEQYGETADRLRQLAASEDYAALQFLAHSLKSVFGNLSATAGQALATQLDMVARQQDPASAGLALQLADCLDDLLADVAQGLAETSH